MKILTAIGIVVILAVPSSAQEKHYIFHSIKMGEPIGESLPLCKVRTGLTGSKAIESDKPCWAPLTSNIGQILEPGNNTFGHPDRPIVFLDKSDEGSWVSRVDLPYPISERNGVITALIAKYGQPSTYETKGRVMWTVPWGTVALGANKKDKIIWVSAQANACRANSREPGR